MVSPQHVSKRAHDFRASPFIQFSRGRHRGGPAYKSICDIPPPLIEVGDAYVQTCPDDDSNQRRQFHFDVPTPVVDDNLRRCQSSASAASDHQDALDLNIMLSKTIRKRPNGLPLIYTVIHTRLLKYSPFQIKCYCTVTF